MQLNIELNAEPADLHASVQTRNFAMIYEERALSSASKGRCSKISMGSVSPAITTMDAMPRLSVFVATRHGNR